MMHSRRSQVAVLAVLAVLAAASAALRGPLNAQATQDIAAAAQQLVQLAFGYECGDRFLVRNDGALPVDVEYGVAGDLERSKLHLTERQAVELSSGSDQAVELWVNGRIVATALKGKSACATNEVNSGVVVRPIDPRDYIANVEPAYGYPPQLAYVGGWPWYGYYAPYVSVGVPFFGAYGGFGRVVVRSRGRFGW